MKKMIALILIICMILCLVACASTGSKDYEESTRNRFASVPAQTDLYYDTQTKIVYVIFNERHGYAGYGYMSPYYADNGLPYIYNTERGCLEKIDGE